MNTYLDFVKEFKQLAINAAKVPLGSKTAANKNAAKFDPSILESHDGCTNKVLIFAPHPDDESMIGSLAIRLQKECGFEVTNVAVTLGSNKARRPGRRDELSQACKYLNWNLHICGAEGFDDIKSDTKLRNQAHWQSCVNEIASIIKSANPAVILAPHTNDWNQTHIGVGMLVSEALNLLSGDYKGLFAQTEYWGAMAKPNLMIEVDDATVAEQITAVSCHIKEVERNDYHLRLPSWLADNVRRGGEIVGGQGGAAPTFMFGVIYNILTFSNGNMIPAFSKGLFIAANEPISKIFK